MFSKGVPETIRNGRTYGIATDSGYTQVCRNADFGLMDEPAAIQIHPTYKPLSPTNRSQVLDIHQTERATVNSQISIDPASDKML